MLNEINTDYYVLQIHGLATISSMYMPAFLPACAVLKEVGCYTLDGDKIANLMVDSPDGLIEMNHTSNCCNEELDIAGYTEKISIEIKSPFPNPLQMGVYYNLPRGYVIQVLSYVASTGATSNIYTCVGSNSVTFIECLFDNALWQVLWNNIKDRFDWPNPRFPKKISEISKHVIPLLDEYIDRSSFFICELSLVHEIDGKMPKFQSGNPYTGTGNEWTLCLEDEDLMKEMFHEICDLAIEAIKDSHQILHEEANEILAFLAADSEWKLIPGVPCHLPLAYALKGSSLSIEVMHKLVNDICDHCTQNNIDVLCEVYDGQFLQLILKDDNAQLLTRMQLCKDISMHCKKMSKKTIIN